MLSWGRYASRPLIENFWTPWTLQDGTAFVRIRQYSEISRKHNHPSQTLSYQPFLANVVNTTDT